MTKDKKVSASKDKDFSKSLNVASLISQAMNSEKETEATLFEKENTETPAVEVKVDYEKAYGLALVTIVELEEAMKNIMDEKSKVQEVFGAKFEELQDLVKMLCVEFDYK